MICEKQESLARGSAARRSARLLLSGRNGVSRTVTCWKIGSGGTRTRERLQAKPINPRERDKGMLKSLVIVILSLALAVPAGAQTAPADPAASSSSQPKLKDPNRTICEKQEEIGSRLGGKKVCHTAAE